MNRWKLESMRTGVMQELDEEAKVLTKMYGDNATTKEQRQAQQVKVEDIKERLEGINKQIAQLDAEAEQRLRKQVEADDQGGDSVTVAKAMLYRSTMNNQPTPRETLKALKDDNGTTGGDKFLPKTVAQEILAEPTVKNPLRGISTMTNITNLEIPRVAFSLEDDDFIADGETAREIAAKGATVPFGRNKFKVFVDISETVLLGTDTNLVGVVDRGLESGLAKKEKKVAFAHIPKTGEEHMSFYNKSNGTDYDIKAVSGATKFGAILAAIADLEEDYRENASVVMPFAYYIDILLNLANGSTTLYGVQPEQVIGKPVVFCDMATVPVIGDFSYSHYNYDIAMQYERDKNIKTGMNSFVLTAWMDHQVKMKSAFRLAVEEVVNPG